MTGLPADIRDRPRTARAMSNCDRSIDPGMERDLRAGQVGAYYGWNFCCDYVWFDSGCFLAAVFRYGQLREVKSADSLEDLMREVSESYGWD